LVGKEIRQREERLCCVVMRCGSDAKEKERELIRLEKHTRVLMDVYGL
jgi:hypothetical protein